MHRYSEEEKQTHITLWQESGLSKLGYSKTIGITYKTFLRWCNRYVPSAKPRAETSQSFIPVSIPPQQRAPINEPIELQYPNGIILRLPIDCPIEKLKTLLLQ